MSDAARRVLVTGATGGFGLAIVAALAGAGHEVRATGRNAAPASRLEGLGAEFVAADLTEKGVADRLCDGRDSIVHAAALSASWGDPRAFEAINVRATRALLDAAARAGVQRFVFISSPSIYAEMRDRIGLTEADPPARDPLNHYALTKLVAERMVLAASGPDFAATAIRPRAIVGPDDKVLRPRLAALASRRRVPLPRGGQALVEFTDARDAAGAVVLAEAKIAAVAGRPVNISGGRPLPVRDIAARLAGALGTSPRFVNIPMPVARAVAWLGNRRRADGPEPVLTPYTLATLAYSQTFDLAFAREALDYAPRHDALEALLAAAS